MILSIEGYHQNISKQQIQFVSDLILQRSTQKKDLQLYICLQKFFFDDCEILILLQNTFCCHPSTCIIFVKLLSLFLNTKLIFSILNWISWSYSPISTKTKIFQKQNIYLPLLLSQCCFTTQLLSSFILNPCCFFIYFSLQI